MSKRPLFNSNFEYYSVLQLTRDATPKEIDSRWRSWCKLIHPDKHNDDKDANDFLKIVNEAHSVLIDPDMRQLYDRFLSEHPLMTGPKNEEGNNGRKKAYERYQDYRIVFPASLWDHLERKTCYEEFKDPRKFIDGDTIQLFGQEKYGYFNLFMGIRVSESPEKHDKAAKKILAAHDEFVMIPCFVRERGVMKPDLDNMIRAYKEDTTQRSLNSVFLLEEKTVVYRIYPGEHYKPKKADVERPGKILSVNFNPNFNRWRFSMAATIGKEYDLYFRETG